MFRVRFQWARCACLNGGNQHVNCVLVAERHLGMNGRMRTIGNRAGHTGRSPAIVHRSNDILGAVTTGRPKFTFGSPLVSQISVASGPFHSTFSASIPKHFSMRITERRFSLPFCIFDEEMPDKTFRLLSYLFSISDFKGASRPGYREMKKAAGIGSDATVKAALDYLRKEGWIFHIKKGGSNASTIMLDIPSRLRKKDLPADVYISRAKSAKKGFPVLHSVKF